MAFLFMGSEPTKIAKKGLNLETKIKVGKQPFVDRNFLGELPDYSQIS